VIVLAEHKPYPINPGVQADIVRGRKIFGSHLGIDYNVLPFGSSRRRKKASLSAYLDTTCPEPAAKTLWPTRFWTGFHVTVCLLMLYLCVMGSSENQLYQLMVNQVVKPEMSSEQAALALLHTTHKLLMDRKFWADWSTLGIRHRFLRGSDIELMVPGSCGSHSLVLVKALQMAGFKARFCQMKVGETWGGHIVVEAEVEPGRWAVLGPMWDNSFRRPDGKLASFADVKKDWDFYSTQLPADYNRVYCYADVRYTNWNKIPVLMPVFHWVLALFVSQESLDGLCIRSYFTNIYYTYAIILGIAYFFVIGGRFFMHWFRKRRLWPKPRGMKYDGNPGNRQAVGRAVIVPHARMA
jgi:hypothetical protein